MEAKIRYVCVIKLHLEFFFDFSSVPAAWHSGGSYIFMVIRKMYNNKNKQIPLSEGAKRLRKLTGYFQKILSIL